jgi:hypothetical protein
MVSLLHSKIVHPFLKQTADHSSSGNPAHRLRIPISANCNKQLARTDVNAGCVGM